MQNSLSVAHAGNAIGLDPQRRSREDSNFRRPGRPSENERFGRQGSYQDGGGPPPTAAPYNPLDRCLWLRA